MDPLAMGFMLLAGCAVGPDFKEPVVEAPTAYRTAGHACRHRRRFEVVGAVRRPAALRSGDHALENNRDLKIAVSRIEQARATVGFTRADQYPRVDGEAGAQIGNFNGGSRSPDTDIHGLPGRPAELGNRLLGKIQTVHRIGTGRSDGLRIRTESRPAGPDCRGGRHLLPAAGFSPAAGHFRIHPGVAHGEPEDYPAALRQRHHQRAGCQPGPDPKRDRGSGIPSLPAVNIAKTENGLAVLLGRLPESVRIKKNLAGTPPPDIPVGLPSDILVRRPDILQASYLLKAQTERIGVAEALRLPAISLTGTLGVASSDLGAVTTEGGVWSIGGRLLGPIIDFGKNKRRVEIEEQRTQQALYQYENTVLTAFREVEDALVEIATYRDELAAVDRQQKAAKNANNLSKERYDKGVSSYLEVLDTERTLFSAELQQSDLQQQYRNAYVNLYKALGGGWVSQAERNEQIDPERPLNYTTQLDATTVDRVE
jgi:multidrug efflux system outer membrane protein